MLFWISLSRWSIFSDFSPIVHLWICQLELDPLSRARAQHMKKIVKKKKHVWLYLQVALRIQVKKQRVWVDNTPGVYNVWLLQSELDCNTTSNTFTTVWGEKRCALISDTYIFVVMWQWHISGLVDRTLFTASLWGLFLDLSAGWALHMENGLLKPATGEEPDWMTHTYVLIYSILHLRLAH